MCICYVLPVAGIQSMGWEVPYAAGVANQRKKKKKRTQYQLVKYEIKLNGSQECQVAFISACIASDCKPYRAFGQVS